MVFEDVVFDNHRFGIHVTIQTTIYNRVTIDKKVLTANPLTNIVDFGGFDSSKILII